MSKTPYLDDSYLKEAEATIESVKDDKYIVLDQTIFYPKGGGQTWDEGTITNESGESFKVVFVGKFSGQISHEVDKPGLKQGDKVKLILDWNRRYKLMRAHTAAHVICRVINKNTGAIITGNQLETDKVRIDFNLENFDRDAIGSYIKEANEVLDQDLPITTKTMPREEAERLPTMTFLAKGLPPEIKEVRIVSIGDFDVQADGGTHVKTTKEVGHLKLVEIKNKGKNNRRLYIELID